MSSKKERNFLVKEDETLEYLFADSSEDETDLQLDSEDIGFLEQDADATGEEVIIEPPDRPSTSSYVPLLQQQTQQDLPQP